MKPFLKAFLIFLVIIPIQAQQAEKYVWHDPLTTVDQFDGQGWKNIRYNRLPEKAEAMVRLPLWSLSRNSAGLVIRFTSNSDNIVIEYAVKGRFGMNHMPPTGVSGVDLYVKNKKEWLWCRGRYQFKDTISYNFKIDRASKNEREYQLFLPLYNSVKDLRIGVSENSGIIFHPKSEKNPIVVYGTSIAQGACASRPGMAWTNILSRRLNEPVINLGFSGNGRLEKEMIELLVEINASVYILDCLPNLSPNAKRTKEEIQRRIVNSVTLLREKHKNTPILLVQHAGYSDGFVDIEREKVYATLNSWMTETYKQLKVSGTHNLHMLTKEEIALSNDAFVDGTHPTDLGMQQYAEAYEKIVNEIRIK